MSVPGIVLEALDLAPQNLAPPTSYSVWGVTEGAPRWQREECSEAQMRALLPELVAKHETVLVYRVVGGLSTLVLRYDVEGISE